MSVMSSSLVRLVLLCLNYFESTNANKGELFLQREADIVVNMYLSCIELWPSMAVGGLSCRTLF